MLIRVTCECGQSFHIDDVHKGSQFECSECGENLTADGELISSHDVFISHSTKNKTIADAVCATLEAHGIRCWMAPRDIKPGADWGESILDGIENCRLFLLVFSSHANDSRHVMREVERAVNKGLYIIPFRIDDVTPSKSMEYFLSSQHWLDAMTSPLEKHLEELAGIIANLLEGNQGSAKGPSAENTKVASQPKRTKSKSKTILAAVSLFIVVLAAALVIPKFFKPAEKSPPGNSSTPVPKKSASETKILEALDKPFKTYFIDTPLSDVASWIADAFKVNVVIDRASLMSEGYDIDEPITIDQKEISLRSALNLMLDAVGGGLDGGLSFVVRDEVLLITTKNYRDSVGAEYLAPKPDKIEGPVPQKLIDSLNKAHSEELVDYPLEELLNMYQAKYGLAYSVDPNSLVAILNMGANPMDPVTLKVDNISLRSILRLLLLQVEARYEIRNEVVYIMDWEEPATDKNAVMKKAK